MNMIEAGMYLTGLAALSALCLVHPRTRKWADTGMLVGVVGALVCIAAT